MPWRYILPGRGVIDLPDLVPADRLGDIGIADFLSVQDTASIGPPLTKMDGIFRRAAAISRPGTFLSQLGTMTRPSNGCAVAIASVESAISSRVTSEYFIPSCPIGDPVADRDRRKHDRYAASHGNALLYGFDHLIDVHMAGHNIVLGTDNPDQRLPISSSVRPSAYSNAAGAPR